MPANIPRPASSPEFVTNALSRHGRVGEALLPVLSEINAIGRPLKTEVLQAIATELDLPARDVQGVASFYALLDREESPRPTLRACDGIACWLNDAHETRRSLISELSASSEIRVTRSSCLGLCDRAPAALFDGRQCGPIKVGVGIPIAGDPYCGLPLRNDATGEQRVLLSEHGVIDPASIDDAVDNGVYDGLCNALSISGDDVVERVTDSNLRGRGGAGFPAGLKWRAVSQEQAAEKYVICNADESEPLMFKDRALIDGNPHALIAGIAIAAWAVGASMAYIYIRGEYEPQATLLEHAIREARSRGLLENPQAGFSLSIHVHRGAGAYICGEETALLESLEGRRGEPRLRPPYPSTVGLRKQPTIVNNVETLCYVSRLFADDAPRTADTRLFTLLGHIQEPGLVEVPLGTTLRELLELAGGMKHGSKFKLALVGGAAGTAVDESMFDTPLNYSTDELPMGSGGILFCDQTVSARALVRELMFFFENESCGKCTPCRIGTSVARETLDRVPTPGAAGDQITRLRHLGSELRTGSICGLGSGAADPLISAMERFEDDFLAGG